MCNEESVCLGCTWGVVGYGWHGSDSVPCGRCSPDSWIRGKVNQVSVLLAVKGHIQCADRSISLSDLI